MKSLENLRKGILTEVNDAKFQNFLTDISMDLISRPLDWKYIEQEIADLIIRISNICYNNTTSTVLPLDDGIYDRLLAVYKQYNQNYQVGAEPIQFPEQQDGEIIPEKKLMYHTIPDSELDSKLYTRDIQSQYVPLTQKMRPMTMYTLIQDPISKRLINTKHKYPELVGTLDKCKFVLNNDAIQADAYNTPAVQIFERDFIHPCLASGIINPDTKFEMVGELKYDGISIEAEVLGDRIISAYSRGDTSEDVATDLTPILSRYVFYNASKVPKDTPFGIKFEAVITRRNLELLGEIRNKKYKNGRNAIIGLFGASDAYRFVDYITLIPLSTSLEMNRIDELNFLNKYYNTGEYNRFCVFRGNYQEILFQVKQFTESAETIRSVIPYMIDGVVISFTDPNIIKILGRINSVNKYQMAIKFNPREVRTIFLYYTYEIGKSGEVTPMVHFKPAEFIGTIHTKQTIHSLQRFNELRLIPGQEIDVKYVNDVLTYIEKPDTQVNRDLEATKIPVPFITNCPFCGAPIEISDSGKSARCPNINCHERRIKRMVDMLSILNFKDISEEVVRVLDLQSFTQLVQPWSKRALDDILGPLTTNKFIDYCYNLITTPIADYKIMAALSFEGMAEEKWKRILNCYSLHVLLAMNSEQLIFNLNHIHGIGPQTVQAIFEGFNVYHDEIKAIVEKINLIDSAALEKKPKVALTGTRDPMMIDIINTAGYDCSDKYSVTKETSMLITTDLNSSSGKMQKARKYGIPVMTFKDFCVKHNITLMKF